MIKEAYLNYEIEKIKVLLEKNDLKLDKLITKSIYIEENDEIIGTVSYYKNIIKCLAVDENYQNENYASLLVNEIMKKIITEENSNQILVYTKSKYINVFVDLGFTVLVDTKNTVLLERGCPGIIEKLENIKQKAQKHFSINLNEKSIASVVINGNPPTIGHLKLIEKAASENEYVICFILEEDLSFFKYEERLELLKKSTERLTNVLIIPSTEYLVSTLTFPSYFLKEKTDLDSEWAKIDAMLFKNYFIKHLNISKRYVGTEESETMKIYNNSLKKVLKDKLIVMPRFSTYMNRREDRIEVVSASKVREYIQNGKISEAMELIPEDSKKSFEGIVENKLSEKILNDREDRNKKINSILKNSKLDSNNQEICIICLKANIVGYNKNVYLAKIVINYYARLIERYLNNKTYNKYYFDSFDGPYVLYETTNILKDDLISLEDSEEIGRLVDLDLYNKSTGSVSLSRENKRKCLICNNDGFICIRNKTHEKMSIAKKMDTIVFTKLKWLMQDLLKESMVMELNLEPKFGLVTPVTNGSHPDMDYYMMRKSQDVIIPYLIDMFEYAYNCDDLDLIYSEVKRIGLDAEREMYRVTNNVNCYKGLIFSLGLIVTSLGYYFKHDGDYSDIFNNIKYMTRNIYEEFSKYKSFGVTAYYAYNIGGARKEAREGFSIINDALTRLRTFSRQDLYQTLIYLIINCEDTVLLKRARTIQKYNDIKDIFKNESFVDERKIKELTQKFISENISFGGSADLLVCTIFLKKLNSFIYLKGAK